MSLPTQTGADDDGARRAEAIAARWMERHAATRSIDRHTIGMLACAELAARYLVPDPVTEPRPWDPVTVAQWWRDLAARRLMRQGYSEHTAALLIARHQELVMRRVDEELQEAAAWLHSATPADAMRPHGGAR